MMKRTMKVDIWSDFVCPFCYIGRKMFEDALREYNLWGKVELNYKSYELDTKKDRDKGADPVRLFAEQYHMPLAKAQRILEKTQARVEKVGLDYNYTKTIPANTFNAHRLNYYAKEFNKQEESNKRIMHAYFAEGLDIGDINILSHLGKDIGLNKEDIMDMFNSNKYYAEMEDDKKLGKELQVDIVPTYIVNSAYRMSGILSYEDYLEMVQKMV